MSIHSNAASYMPLGHNRQKVPASIVARPEFGTGAGISTGFAPDGYVQFCEGKFPPRAAPTTDRAACSAELNLYAFVPSPGTSFAHILHRRG